MLKYLGGLANNTVPVISDKHNELNSTSGKSLFASALSALKKERKMQEKIEQELNAFLVECSKMADNAIRYRILAMAGRKILQEAEKATTAAYEARDAWKADKSGLEIDRRNDSRTDKEIEIAAKDFIAQQKKTAAEKAREAYAKTTRLK